MLSFISGLANMNGWEQGQVGNFFCGLDGVFNKFVSQPTHTCICLQLEWRNGRAWKLSLLDHCIFSRKAAVPQSSLCPGGRNRREQGRNMLVNQFPYNKLCKPCTIDRIHIRVALLSARCCAFRCGVVIVLPKMITNGIS